MKTKPTSNETNVNGKGIILSQPKHQIKQTLFIVDLISITFEKNYIYLQ